MESVTILAVLKQIPLFQELNEIDHQDVANRVVMNYHQAGKVLCREGEPGTTLYIVKSGMVKISRKDQSGADREVATLGGNDFFGEMALISDEPRNATATVIEDAAVFELSKSDFFKLIEKTPGLANRISTEFIARVKANSQKSIDV
ncbi:MAG: cyclic nucleotide-binding domain-containing protein [Patescibacteria group bacterium]